MRKAKKLTDAKPWVLGLILRGIAPKVRLRSFSPNMFVSFEIQTTVLLVPTPS